MKTEAALRSHNWRCCLGHALPRALSWPWGRLFWPCWEKRHGQTKGFRAIVLPALSFLPTNQQGEVAVWATKASLQWLCSLQGSAGLNLLVCLGTSICPHPQPRLFQASWATNLQLRRVCPVWVLRALRNDPLPQLQVYHPACLSKVKLHPSPPAATSPHPR